MASEIAESVPPPSMVGNAFVEQYYNMLCQAPENVHKFYQNSSFISRPNDDGSMASASTLDGIDKLIISLDCKNCHVEILTADSQASIGNGVIVLVTGYFTGVDAIKRKFSQLFFLVPQETNEYFVLNDVFRYVDVSAVTAPNDSTPSPREIVYIEANNIPPNSDEGQNEEQVEEVVEEVVDEEETEASENSIQVEISNHSDIVDEQDISTPENHEDAPKKSYASVANALNFKKQPFQQRHSPTKQVEKIEIPPPVQPPPLPVQPIGQPDAVKGHSIFVANLPMNATTEQLKEVFEKFGSIKADGIQVRSYRQEKNCFGFIEFESSASMHSALKVTSIMIGNRIAHIEEKKATGDTGKYSIRKNGFGGDNVKQRGRFSGRNHPITDGKVYRQSREAVMKS